MRLELSIDGSKEENIAILDKENKIIKEKIQLKN